MDFVKALGMKKSGMEGVLITKQEDYNELIKGPKSKINLIVWCGKKEHNPWVSSIYSLMQEKWCKKCYDDRRVITYDIIKQKVSEVGNKKYRVEGVLLTTESEFNNLKNKYIPSRIPLQVWCGNDEHKPWLTNWDNLKQEKWCKKCYHESLIKYSFSLIKELIKNIGLERTGRKGILIYPKTEDEFINIYKKSGNPPSEIPLKVWCGNDSHPKFITCGSKLKINRSWCPICSEGYYEKICRWYFQKIFRANFPKTRLKSIISNYEGLLELDGFSIVNINGIIIKLAFEFNGIQHYDFPNYFHKTYNEFLEQIKRDNIKVKLCEENNIIIIIIPQTIDMKMNHPEIIQNYIINEFRKKTGIILRNIPQYDYHSQYLNYPNLDKFLDKK
ncbi:MAG: hypothetical protein ACTSRH_16355 [Promethearchaeota archaeon]